MTGPYFRWVPRDLAGRDVFVVARPFSGDVPASAFVVHVNNAWGWSCCGRCDELFTVINNNLLLSAAAEFRSAAASARVIRCRIHSSNPTTVLGRLLPSSDLAKVSDVQDDPKLNSRLTTGMYAAVYYEARGGRVTLCGFSEDRASLLRSFHKPALADERELLRRFRTLPQL